MKKVRAVNMIGKKAASFECSHSLLKRFTKASNSYQERNSD